MTFYSKKALVKISSEPARRALIVGESPDKQCWKVRLAPSGHGKEVIVDGYQTTVWDYHKSFVMLDNLGKTFYWYIKGYGIK